MTAAPSGTREISGGERRSVAYESPAGNARTPLRVLLVIRLPSVLCCFVSSKFACDHRFLLEAVHTKKSSPFFAPAGCSPELFQKSGSQ